MIHLAPLCPANFPYAMDDFKKCCNVGREDDGSSEGCRGEPLTYKSTCCIGDYVDCEDCVSNMKGNE